MESFTRTGVFCTEEEAEAIKSRIGQPVILVGGIDLSRPTPQEKAHELALAHGLPEIPGYYGVDFRNREFVK